jgi:hypothetical protein
VGTAEAGEGEGIAGRGGGDLLKFGDGGGEVGLLVGLEEEGLALIVEVAGVGSGGFAGSGGVVRIV